MIVHPRTRCARVHRTLGMFCSGTLHFLHSLPFPAATAAAAFCILHLPRQAIVRFALHTAPYLCWCLTVCFHTPLWGLGADGLFVTHELSHVVLCGHDTSELLSYQNPRDKHLSLESPLPRLILLLLPQLFEHCSCCGGRVHLSLRFAMGRWKIFRLRHVYWHSSCHELSVSWV